MNYNGEPIAGRLPPFKPELRAKVRADDKTHTRRVIKNMPACDIEGAYFDAYNGGPQWNWWTKDNKQCNGHGHITCPYGKPGELRVMTEPLKERDGRAYYRDTGDMVLVPHDDPRNSRTMPWRWSKPYLTSIHMPHEAARTIVRLKRIWVERVCDISEEDAIAEGLTVWHNANCEAFYGQGIADVWEVDPRKTFSRLWDSINGKRDDGKYSWAANPWVWCVEWELVTR
jgi:hypothetical protein